VIHNITAGLGSIAGRIMLDSWIQGVQRGSEADFL
jgi:hypothetical protein